jgi:single-strand DNA-binding protein
LQVRVLPGAPETAGQRPSNPCFACSAVNTTIVGNLVDDPELRFTNNGIAVANLRVAVTQRIQQDGEWRDGDTSFLRVNVWRGQAEHLADSLGKGDRVMVTGRLRQRGNGDRVASRERAAERGGEFNDGPPTY